MARGAVLVGMLEPFNEQGIAAMNAAGSGVSMARLWTRVSA